MIQVFKLNGGGACPKGTGETHAAGLVAVIGTIVYVVGTEHPGKKLE